MPRPEVDIMQSSAEGTHEASPKAGTSVTDSRSLSIATTPAETFPEKEIAPQKTVSPTNLTQGATGDNAPPVIGTATCWNTLQSIQDTIVEASKEARATRLSTGEEGGLRGKVNEKIGVAKVGAATCWTSFSKMAWDLALPAGDENKKYAETKSPTTSSKSSITNAERLKNLAALSVKAPELPTEEEVDEDGLQVEVIEQVDSL